MVIPIRIEHKGVSEGVTGYDESLHPCLDCPASSPAPISGNRHGVASERNRNIKILNAVISEITF